MHLSHRTLFPGETVLVVLAFGRLAIRLRMHSHRLFEAGERGGELTVGEYLDVFSETLYAGLELFVPDLVLLAHAARYIDRSRLTLAFVLDGCSVRHEVLQYAAVVT